MHMLIMHVQHVISFIQPHAKKTFQSGKWKFIFYSMPVEWPVEKCIMKSVIVHSSAVMVHLLPVSTISSYVAVRKLEKVI